MAKLGVLIAEAIIHHYGRDEFLRRLSHPFWFQSFGSVMGHGLALFRHHHKRPRIAQARLESHSKELGLHVCGGRGSHSRKTPHELIDIGVRVGIDGAALANVSRLVAKVDSAALQDEFDLYLHGLKLRERLGFKRAAGRGRPKTRRHHAQHAQNRRSVQRFGWRYTINA
jgi:hypothetical protein